MDKAMINEYLKLNIPLKDKEFDMIYSVELRNLSERHFTPMNVAIKAAEMLAHKPNQKILDIGSGVGKFCFIASSYTDASYTGVDYRKHFVDLCNKLTNRHSFKNVDFIHADIKEIDIRNFDGIYFFNSFQEHMDGSAKLDDSIDTSLEKFKTYFEYLKEEFEKMPDGTRIVTYHVSNNQMPNSYKAISTHFGTKLKCWEKTSDPIAKLL